MLDKARNIMGKRLFSTVQDYNLLIDGIAELEQVAKENRQNLTPDQRNREIQRRQKKIDALNQKGYERSKLGRMGSGNLTLQLGGYAQAKAILRQQIELLQTNS